MANTAVTAGKIDFSSFGDNQSNIRKIYTYSATQTTDSNGLWGVPTSVVTPQNGVIVGVKVTNYGDGGLWGQVISNKTSYVIRFRNWDLNATGNNSVSATIFYIKA